MSEPNNDQRLLNQYLLGALPESEAERLDELSITDDTFAARLSEAENDLVDGYVRDELRGETLERFKTHYLSSAMRRDKVKFGMVLRETSRAQSPSVVLPKVKQPVWLSKLFGRPALQWSLAAVAIVFISVAGLLAFDDFRLRRQMAESQATNADLNHRQQELQAQLDNQRNAAQQTEQELAQLRAQQPHAEPLKSPETGLVAMLFLTPQLRGAGQLPTVKIEPATKSVSAHLELEPNDYSAYQVAIIDSANRQTIWTSTTLKATMKGENKSLRIVIQTGLLKQGNYSLRVFGVAPNSTREMISDYPFKVVK
jgi:hypothetical protein